MPLFHAEAHLLAAGTALAIGDPELARQHADDAKTLIRQHHYARREPDLAVLDAEIAISALDLDLALDLDCCSPLPLSARQPAAESAQRAPEPPAHSESAPSPARLDAPAQPQ